MDFRLTNGNPKVTVIQKFNHSVVLLGPEYGKRRVFNDLEDAKYFVESPVKSSGITVDVLLNVLPLIT